MSGSDAWFVWTDERLAQGRRLYLDEGLGPSAVARVLGEGCTAGAVTYAARRHGWDRGGRRPPKGAFHWTEEAVAKLCRLWGDRSLTREDIAAQLGAGCTGRAVSRKGGALGLPCRTGAARLPGGRAGSVKSRVFTRTAPARGCERRRRRAQAFAARFVAAGWTVEETAWLFDLRTHEVAQAAGGATA